MVVGVIGPLAAGQPYNTGFNGLHPDYHNAPGSQVNYVDSAGATVATLSSLSIVEAGLRAGAALPGPGVLITAILPVIGTFDLGFGAPITADVADAEMTIIGRSTNTDATQPRTFDIELVSLQLRSVSLLPDFVLRESPTMPSTGQLIMTPVPGTTGQWDVDSFFDVWTELSVDRGATFIFSDGPMPQIAFNFPSPGSLSVLTLASIVGLRRRR